MHGNCGMRMPGSPAGSDTGFMATFRRNTEIAAALQLFITTKEEQYATRFKEMIFPTLDRSLFFGMAVALQAVPYLDKDYKNKLRDYVVKFKANER